MVLLAAVQPVLAEVYVTGPIKILRTGWNSDSFGLELEAPQQNPAGCPNPLGYVSESSLPGYQTYYAAALAAYGAGKPVTAVIDSNTGVCVHGYPKIIGINLPG
ncbi:hypothetical protein VE25_21495 [Devosia geojensis]|uniref:Uncharacterized protein n=1 Tax=Devosia geojensis TaxID=443610 RepID=A0A0F5FD20_9HYPH|nr:hypothetical protein VE25_21495 [Devosia geojensis]